MNLLFLLKEGIVGFKRARLAAGITIVTIMLSLLLIGIFGLVAQNLSDTFNRLYNKVYLEVFIDPTLQEAEILALKERVEKLPPIRLVEYVSPAAALKTFEEDFGQDLMQVLGSNPLPPSFRIAVKPTHSAPAQIDKLVLELESFVEVDEVDYQKQFIQLMDDYFWIGLVSISLIGAAIFFITTMLIYNTIRLTIHSRNNVIEIMRLVGASSLFIKGPFIVEGILQGLIGSSLACGILWLISDTIQAIFSTVLTTPYQFYGSLIFIGMLLGLLGSYISVGKYLRY